MLVGDGALGTWAALDEVWPECRRQRWWNHRIINDLDRLPQRLWSKVRKEIRGASETAVRAECKRQLEAIAGELRRAGQADAAVRVLRDVDDSLIFYDFPQGHWMHLRPTNPIESPFAGIRLRADLAKRFPNRENQ